MTRPLRVDVDRRDVRARHDLQAAGLLRARNRRHVRAVLGVDVAAAACCRSRDTCTPSGSGSVRELIGGRPGERMPAERRAPPTVIRSMKPVLRSGGIGYARLRGAFEDVAARIDRALDVAGLARHADLVLDLVVVRLELVVAERPVFDRRSLRHARRAVALRGLADDLEVPRIEPPALRPVVQRRAADGVHHRMAAGARGVAPWR